MGNRLFVSVDLDGLEDEVAAVQETVRERDPDAGTLTVEEVRLTESTLRADGPAYTTLERVEL